MHPVVEVRQPNQAALYLSLRGRVELGRECDGLLLADPQVSRRHLALDVVGGAVVVEDLGSTNGSTVDGRPLRQAVALGPGSVVQCGATTVQLESRVDATMRTAAGGSGASVSDTFDPDRTVVARPSGGSDQIRSSGSTVGRSSIDIVAASARDDGVDLRSLPADQGTVTIVFSDIESSTERVVELGDQIWFEILESHNRIVRTRVRQFGGSIVKNQGDGFMLSFSGARRALDCMTLVQLDLAKLAATTPERAVRVRIGLHTGEVLADADGDLFGTHVVVAARIAGVARGGEILLSALTREIVAARGDLVFGAPRDVHLKGIGDAMAYPFDWTTQTG
ncbi:MAG: adenylate/guanylate cyclase domain-containing protein [Ilumatobacter sp.]